MWIRSRFLVMMLAKASGEISIKCGSYSADHESVLLSHANNTLFDVYYLVAGECRQALSRENLDRVKFVGGADCRHVRLQIAHEPLADGGSYAVFVGETVAL